MGKPPQGSRNWMAWCRAEAILADGEWHYTNVVVEAMMQAGGIQKKTATNLLSEAVGWGVVERQGYKRGLWNGGYVDRRMVRSVPDKEARFDRERAMQDSRRGHQDYSPTPRRGEALHDTAGPAAEETPSRTGNLDRIRTEMEQEKLRLGGPPPPNVNVNDDSPFTDPNRTFTLEELSALRRQANERKRAARQGRRRPPDQPSGY